uniref:Selectin P ligand n=1 Tax=Phasianus colchicus TaxID=9054 RepID=A0A669PGG8_PHACC
MHRAKPLPSSFPRWGPLCHPIKSALRDLCLHRTMGAASFRTAFPITSAFTCAFSTSPSPRDHHPGRGAGGRFLGARSPLASGVSVTSSSCRAPKPQPHFLPASLGSCRRSAAHDAPGVGTSAATTNTPEVTVPLGTELPPKVNDSTSQAKALVVTTVDPSDETDSPETAPDTAPQSGSTVVPNQLMESTGHGTDGTMTSDMDISTEPGSTLLPTTTFSKKSASHPPWEMNTTPLSTKPRGTTTSDTSDDLWDSSSLMNKCLLAILLLALVAGLFMVCTAVLGTLLWRRVRTARRQLGPTEMICISSLLPDSECAANNGPRRGIPVRHRLLVDASSEADGDNLTLSSFLPEHS